MVRTLKRGISDIALHLHRYHTKLRLLYKESVIISALPGALLQSQLMASQQGGDEGGPSQGSLSQEAVDQLSQATLSMTQLTQGSNRLQACRCVPVCDLQRALLTACRLDAFFILSASNCCVDMLHWCDSWLTPGYNTSGNPCFGCMMVYPPPSPPTLRWFAELLALKSRGLVRLSQPEPYADVDVGVTQTGIEASFPLTS